MPRRPDLPTLAAFGGAVLLGSANIVAVRFSNRELEPLWGAGVRFAVAASVLSAIGLVTRRPFPRERALRGALWFGLFAFTGAYALFYIGAVEVPAGTAGVHHGAGAAAHPACSRPPSGSSGSRGGASSGRCWRRPASA